MSNTPDTPQLTPIEKAIEELYNLADQHEYEPEEKYGIEKSIEKLRSILPYQRQYLRDSAEKVWDACHDRLYYLANDSDEIPPPDKQTYLNQNHPL